SGEALGEVLLRLFQRARDVEWNAAPVLCIRRGKLFRDHALALDQGGGSVEQSGEIQGAVERRGARQREADRGRRDLDRREEDLLIGDLEIRRGVRDFKV